MSRDYIKSLYDRLESRWKTPAARLGMSTPALQRKSFTAALDFTERFFTLEGKSIHDAGCGHGALYPLAKKRGILSYVGSELRFEAVREAKHLHPDAFVEMRDLLEDELPRADITYLLGTHSGCTADESLRMLERTLAASNLAVVFYHWMNTPSTNPTADEANQFQQAVDTLLETNPDRSASQPLGLYDDRLVIISHKPLI